MPTPMSSEAKGLLSKTIRGLRARLLTDLEQSLRQTYKLGIDDASQAKLDVSAALRRARLERWIDEQLRGSSGKPSKDAKLAAAKARLRDDVIKQAGYTLLNRLVYLRLLEAAKLRKAVVLTGGWLSPGYRDFRAIAPDLLGDDSEGYALLLRVVFDELALDLPGLYGRNGLADLVPVPHETLRYVVEQLDRPELAGCWSDDMTLGWVYQYWNDPEREAIDAKLNDGGKVERHEIASKTQMFTERYMVDWLLQNSLGPMWLAMCQAHGWTPLCEQHGTLARLEQRRVDWRDKRGKHEVALTDMMPLDSDEERRWAYYVPQPIPDDAVTQAPKSVREIRLLDPAVGSGHFLVVAFDLLFALYQEEAQHRGEGWSDAKNVEIVESILANNLHGIDLDPRAVQIAAAGLWLKAQQTARGARPQTMNLVASQLRLAGLPDDDPALVELREAVERETGIPAGLTNEIVHALEGADHLGSLLKVGDVLDRVIAKYRETQTEPVQGSLLEGFGAAQVLVAFDEGDARGKLHEQLETFLAAHTGSADLGLRLRGEQLAAGVRFMRLLREGAYDLVVGNPPYQGTAKMADSAYVEKEYAEGKADLFAAFLQRGLGLVREGGVSALLTMRNWMFLKQYAKLRMFLLQTYDLRTLHDSSSGAFEEISAAQVVVSVVSSVFRRAPMSGQSACALKAFDEATVMTVGETQRKRAATLCQAGRHEFEPSTLDVVPEWPLVYWWTADKLQLYRDSPLLGSIHLIASGVKTGNDPRFVRWCFELAKHDLPLRDGSPVKSRWQFYIKGAAGAQWFEPATQAICWIASGLELNVYGAYCAPKTVRLRDPSLYFQLGTAFTPIGAAFSARAHRFPSIIGNMGASVFSGSRGETVCALNSSTSRDILQSLNPTVHFENDDVARLPLLDIPKATEIFQLVDLAFSLHESHREASVEFQSPGPSPWAHAQAWAQLAVDRPENNPLPEYNEQLVPEPNTDHLSFALCVALGRFFPPTSPKLGILDPSTDDLTHALSDGILFLDGTLEPDDITDSLGHPSTSLLRQTWHTHRPENTKRTDLREYLRLDFFTDVHRQMYENRPIHWPLSSEKKTFVAWINIHRWHAGTLRTLLATHLNPTKKRLESQLADLREARHSKDPKAARAAEKLLPRLEKLDAELTQFIAEVSRCSEQGPPPADAKSPKRERDAVYVPDLDDGVLINAAALWPLLLPQWKDPKKWWKELSEAKGRKDYDWSHLAARYFPERVDLKCQQDPSLGVAHGCFWKYHPARAYAWELRLQDEINPECTIDERNSNEARAAFLADHATEANEIEIEESKRRKRKLDKAQADRESALFDPDAEPLNDGEPGGG
jgi:hypothetical protein